jgi:transcriptional regulator with XRE-family HTH domain
MLTPALIRGARAMLQMSQAELAAKAGISKTGLANIELGNADARASTLNAIQAALESAGVEFVNGGMRVTEESPKEVGMESYFQPMRFVSTSIASVRLQTFDGELPVNVVINREAINDYFGLAATTDQQRWEIVEANLGTITALAVDRHRRRIWTEGSSNWGGKYRQIILREEDLKKAELHLPIRRQ